MNKPDRIHRLALMAGIYSDLKSKKELWDYAWDYVRDRYKLKDSKEIYRLAMQFYLQWKLAATFYDYYDGDRQKIEDAIEREFYSMGYPS